VAWKKAIVFAFRLYRMGEDLINAKADQTPGLKVMNMKLSTQIGHNSKRRRRSLEVIAEEIHGLMRRDVFEIGALLAEAREGAPGEHGAWQEWLEQFDFGYRTALNYLKAHDLRLKCETISLLKVPVSVVYNLADDLDRGDLSEDDLQTAVKALDKASKRKSLSVEEAEDVIRFARLRIKWGDLPDATLDGLEYADRGEPWSAAAIEELKQARPETDEAADEIVKKHSVDPTREESEEKDEEEDEEEEEAAESSGNGHDPETDDDHTGPSLQAEKARIVRAWRDASSGAKLEFVRERWDEIFTAHEQLLAIAQEGRWITGDDAR
jgi:hypothetical protein